MWGWEEAYMSNLSALDYLIFFLFVIAAYGFIQGLRFWAGKWQTWDIGEKEKVLQQKLIDLQKECDKYKEEVILLRNQVKLVMGQYDEAVIKLSELNRLYKMAQEEARTLQDQLNRWKEDMEKSEARFNRILIAAVGSPESSLNMDLAALRAVKIETGMAFDRISECTPEKLQSAIDQAKGMQAITYLHLSIKSGPEGYQLMDKVVDANWLSANLQGVVILLVAGSDSTEVGEFIGVVPYIITMNDTLPSKDAARFTRYFWTEVGKGIGPSLAFERAIQRSPGRMSEYVRRHWLE